MTADVAQPDNQVLPGGTTRTHGPSPDLRGHPLAVVGNRAHTAASTAHPLAALTSHQAPAARRTCPTTTTHQPLADRPSGTLTNHSLVSVARLHRVRTDGFSCASAPRAKDARALSSVDRPGPSRPVAGRQLPQSVRETSSGTDTAISSPAKPERRRRAADRHTESAQRGADHAGEADARGPACPARAASWPRLGHARGKGSHGRAGTRRPRCRRPGRARPAATGPGR